MYTIALSISVCVMGKKYAKKFIEAKGSKRYSLLHAKDENNQLKQEFAMFEHPEASLVKRRAPKPTKGGSEFDEEIFGFYDYSKHTKPILEDLGGTFVSIDSEVHPDPRSYLTKTESRFKEFAPPDEKKADELMRRLMEEGRVISESFQDVDFQDEEEEGEIDDDFVLQAMGFTEEDQDFDADDMERKYSEEFEHRDSLERHVFRIPEEDEEVYEEFEEHDEREPGFGEDVDDEDIERAMMEYDDEEIGELDPEEVSDHDFDNRELQVAVEDFLKEKETRIMVCLWFCHSNLSDVWNADSSRSH
jgi:hypothetical protein